MDRKATKKRAKRIGDEQVRLSLLEACPLLNRFFLFRNESGRLQIGCSTGSGNRWIRGDDPAMELAKIDWLKRHGCHVHEWHEFDEVDRPR